MNPKMKNSKISTTDDNDTTEIAMTTLSLSFAFSITLSIKIYTTEI